MLEVLCCSTDKNRWQTHWRCEAGCVAGMIETAWEHDMDVDSKIENSFQAVSLCYSSLSNFVRPLSLAISFMFLWWQLAPVGSVKCCFTSLQFFFFFKLCRWQKRLYGKDFMVTVLLWRLFQVNKNITNHQIVILRKKNFLLIGSQMSRHNSTRQPKIHFKPPF